MATSRPIITLAGRGLVDAADDRRIDLTDYDLLLPCRRFRVEHKVAVLGRVSLTAEFLLRLVKSIDGISEEDAAAFFSFDRREASYVFGETVDHGFVERRDGRLFLSFEGHALFREGSPQPEIFAVETRVETFGFDLISLAPERFRHCDPFETRLPELRLVDGSRASTAGSEVPVAFKRFFGQLSTRKGVGGVKQSLYSIGAVEPGDRFSIPIRLTLASTGLKPSVAEVDLGGWRSENEMDDRVDIRKAAAAFQASLETPRRQDDATAYQMLVELAPEFLSDSLRGGQLSVERYYREAFSRAGEARSDRPTVPLLGSLLLRSNIVRFLDVLNYGLKGGALPKHVFWVVPQTPHWSAVRTLPDLLKQVTDGLNKQSPEIERSPTEAACVVAGTNHRYLEKAFDHVQRSERPVAPSSFEALLIPGVLAAALVHAPIGLVSGIPVPIGILSFDPRVVERMADLIAPAFEGFGTPDSWLTARPRIDA